VSGPACAGTDTDTWFSTRVEDVAACQRICAGCPLRERCLAGAIARDEQWGIWGGRVFRPRWTTARISETPRGWFVYGRTAVDVPACRGPFPNQAEADACAAHLLADSARRTHAAATAGAWLTGRHAFVGTDAA
jgi:Transcription factor WhiB